MRGYICMLCKSKADGESRKRARMQQHPSPYAAYYQQQQQQRAAQQALVAMEVDRQPRPSEPSGTIPTEAKRPTPFVQQAHMRPMTRALQTETELLQSLHTAQPHMEFLPPELRDAYERVRSNVQQLGTPPVAVSREAGVAAPMSAGAEKAVSLARPGADLRGAAGPAFSKAPRLAERTDQRAALPPRRTPMASEAEPSTAPGEIALQAHAEPSRAFGVPMRQAARMLTRQQPSTKKEKAERGKQSGPRGPPSAAASFGSLVGPSARMPPPMPRAPRKQQTAEDDDWGRAEAEGSVRDPELEKHREDPGFTLAPRAPRARRPAEQVKSFGEASLAERAAKRNAAELEARRAASKLRNDFNEARDLRRMADESRSIADLPPLPESKGTAAPIVAARIECDEDAAEQRAELEVLSVRELRARCQRLGFPFADSSKQQLVDLLLSVAH